MISGLKIATLFLRLFSEISDLAEMIMRLRGRVISQPSRRAPVTWVRQWLRRHEDRGQYYNPIAEFYLVDQPTFTNFMQMFLEIFTETEHRLTPDFQRQTTFMRELLITTMMRFLLALPAQRAGWR